VIAGLAALTLTTASASAAQAGPWTWVAAGVGAFVAVMSSPVVVAAATLVGTAAAIKELGE